MDAMEAHEMNLTAGGAVTNDALSPVSPGNANNGEVGVCCDRK